MDWYLDFVKFNPIFSAIIQFAFLGTFGEIASKWIIKKKIHMPFTAPVTLWKAAEWSFLAVCIKYAFVGFTGFVEYLVEHSFLPEMNNFAKAFAISSTMNLQFGLFLVIIHRILDNIIVKEKNWENIDKALLTLIWFWIPAHTVTFLLPKEYQIGFAAIWSVVLGVILGFYNRKNNISEGSWK